MSRKSAVLGLTVGVIIGVIAAALMTGAIAPAKLTVDQDAVDAAYLSGVSDGNAEGYSRGLVEGNSTGYSNGYNAGYSAAPKPTAPPATPDRYNEGYTAGTATGKTQGYSEGYNEGNRTGYTTGYGIGVIAGAGTGYNIRNPTYTEMTTFLAADKTNENTYNITSYYCFHFTADVLNHAYSLGYRAGFVYVEFVDSAHALVCFDTVDKGLVFVEPQDDRFMTLTVGKTYWDRTVYETPDYDDTVVSYVIIW